MNALLEWIDASFWNACLVCFVAISFRPISVNITHNHHGEEDK